jgi:hypothetical protein
MFRTVLVKNTMSAVANFLREKTMTQCRGNGKPQF